MKLEYDKLLSSFAFNCNLHHYIKVLAERARYRPEFHVAAAQAAASETAAAAARSAAARGRPAAHMSGRGFAGSLTSDQFPTFDALDNFVDLKALEARLRPDHIHTRVTIHHI